MGLDWEVDMWFALKLVGMSAFGAIITQSIGIRSEWKCFLFVLSLYFFISLTVSVLENLKGEV
jgi:hypothetical protein